jgi:tape measure domain-containing protein
MVRLQVDARGAISGLRRTKQETQKLEDAVQDLNGRLKDSKGRFVSMGRSATAASVGVKALSGAVGSLAAAFSAIQAFKFVFAKTAELEKQTKSLQVLTGSLEEAKGIIGELQQFAAVTPFTSSDLVETAKRLKAFGISTENLVETTKRLGDVAGATGAELDGIATAFGQIRAKGKLQQEENLQLLERGVDLTSELREMYGLTGEELAKAMTKGQISFEAANEALRRLTDAGGKYANGAIAQSDTLAGKFSTLVDGVETIARTLGNVLSPALKSILDQAIGVVNSINSAAAAGRRILQFGITPGEREKLFRQAEEDAKQLARLRGGGTLDPAEFTRLRAERFKDLIEDFGFRTGQIAPEMTAPAAQQIALPPLLQSAAPTAGTNGKSRRKEKSPEELLQEKLQRLREQAIATDAQALQQQEQREESLNRQVMQLDKQLALLQAGTEEDRKAIERAFQLSELTRGLNDEQAGALAQRLQVRYQEIDALQEQQRKEEQLAEAQKQAAERMAQTYRNIGDAIKTGVVDTLMAAVDQTKSLAEVASNTLRSLANTLLKLGLESAFGALGAGGGLMGKLFGRANGGTVMGGRSYVVGERGPELFTPNRTGSIAPNNAIGGVGNVVVNVDAKGTNVQGDGAEAKQLGDAIGAAVRIELLKQRRPGGLLA